MLPHGHRVDGLVGGDLRRLPLATASCDAAWSSYALLHLTDSELRPALLEVRRVLRPDGAAVLVTASDSAGVEQVAYAPEHSRVFSVRSASTLAGLCGEAGLEVLETATDDSGWRAPVRVVARRP